MAFMRLGVANIDTQLPLLRKIINLTIKTVVSVTWEAYGMWLQVSGTWGVYGMWLQVSDTWEAYGMWLQVSGTWKA